MKAINNDIPILNTSDQEQRTLQEVLATLDNSRWLIAGFVILLTLAGVAHVFIASPIYQAEALVKVDEQTSGVGALEDFSNVATVFNAAAAALESEIGIITSTGVIGTVVDKLNLDVIARPVRLPLIGDAIARSAPDGKVVDPWFDLNNYAWARKYLNMTEYAWGGERIDVKKLIVPHSLLRDTLTLVAGKNGHYQLFGPNNERFGNAEVGELAKLQLPDHKRLTLLVSNLVARPGTHFTLTKQSHLQTINALKDSLTITALGDELAPSGLVQALFVGADPEKDAAVVNEVLRTYIRRSNEWKSVDVGKTIALLQEQLRVVEARTQRAAIALNDYQRQQGAVDLPTETRVTLDRMDNIEAQLSELKIRRGILRQRFTPQHPQIVTLDRQMAALQGELASLEGKVGSLPQVQREILRRSRDVNVNRNLSTLLKSSIQELSIVNAGTLGNARILDKAEVPDSPIRPQKSFVMTLYIMLGFVSGVVAAFLRRMLRGVVEDPDVIEKQLGLPMYAIVPYSAKQEKRDNQSRSLFKNTRRALLAATDPGDPAIECVRSLRTTLNFALLGATSKTLLITGPVPGVGKSFMSVNLSVVLARAGKRTLLIDADMRNGHLHEYFGMKSAPGLSNLIVDDATIEEAIRGTEIERLSIVPAGVKPPNPSELLLHEKFVAALAEISSSFDYVIIDSPPILAVTDAAVIGRIAGAALLVLEADVHPLREIEQSVKRLRQGGVNLVGAVFNGMKTSRRGYGYGKYYSYGYSYSSKGS